MPQFSILIAVFNAAHYLDECLQSLLDQDLKDWQAICIDDCSTDTSTDIIKRYVEMDSRFEYLRTPQNSGQAVARNIGLEIATGTFTLMLDADDYLAPNALSNLWQHHLDRPTADALLFNLTRFWENGSTEPWSWPNDRRVLTGKEACLLSIDWQIHGCYALTTALHQQYPYDTTFRVYSDDTTVRQHFLHCREVVLCEGIYYYRQHAQSSTHQFSLLRLHFVEANRLLANMLEKEDAGSEALRICEEMTWKTLVGIFREMEKRRHSITPIENKIIDKQLSIALSQIHPSRISWKLKLHPSFLYLPFYSLFSAWQRMLIRLRNWMK